MASVDLEYNQGFKIYKGNTWFNNLVLHKATYETVVMSLGDKISGIVYYKNNKLVVDMTEYIMYKNVKYVLVNPPTVIKEGLVSDNGELKGMTKYSFTFYHPMYMLSNFPFSDVAADDSQQYLSQNKTFSWIGNLVDYKDKLNKNLEGTQWKVSIGTNVADAEKNKLSEVLSFDNNTIADALKTAYETWEIPYIVDKVENGTQDYLINGKRFVVQFGLPSNEIYKKDKNGNFILDDNNQKIPFVFKYGQGVGLKNNSRTPKNNKIVTRIAGYGSEDNIPYGYPQIVWTGESSWNYTINNASGMQTITVGGRTIQAMSYPIYDGIVGGQKVRLIKHPFTRTHLMPPIYKETVNKKVNPNATGYDPNTELVDYYDADDNTYPNQIKAGEPSYEIHEFEDIKPEFDSLDIPSGIYSATPYDGHSDESISQDKFLSIVDDLYTETDIKAEKTQLNALRTSFVKQQQNSVKGTSGNYEYDWSFKTDGLYKKVKYTSSGANFEYVVKVGLTPTTIDWDDTMDEQGNYVQSYFKVTIPALGFDLYASAAITQEMTINMRSGACIGCSFPVMVDWDDYKRNFYDKDGNFAPNGTQRNLTKYPNSTNSSITLILQKETNTFGTLMPNIYQKPASGDKFVILGISLPTSYITTAEGKLETEMKKYMRDNNVYYYEYPLKFDEHFLISNEHILSQMKPNVIVNFEYADVEQSLYIKQMSIKYNESPLPKYDITLTDDVDVVLNKIGEAIAEYRGQRQYENGGGNSETLDGNKFLRKDINDTASGTIRMLKGLQVGERFVTGLLGEGGIFRKDDDGTTYLECDRMYVRMKAYFDTVEVRRFLHSGGNRIASAAGMKCSRVEYIAKYGNTYVVVDANGQYWVNNRVIATLPIERYRCYFRAEDNGAKITNDFVIGDLAYCKETNIDTNLSQHGYWRAVVDVSGNANANGEHWIDLSKSDCSSTLNDVPIAQDDIIQLGNKTDKTRQGAIVEYVSGEDAPSYQIYQGINTYSLDNKNYIGLGYSSETNRAYMNVYGDMFVGVKPDAITGKSPTYIKYVQDDGTEQHKPKLTIKGVVEMLSPDDPEETTTLDDFAKAITGDIEYLQQQIDGEIDTWFYDGEPALNKYPASEWTTDTEKKEHLGDLYYDKLNGNAYRFIYDKDSETYSWLPLSDSAILEALRIANEAKDTADHKRRVFLTDAQHPHPTPPYDEGDLWVNAVWPYEGQDIGSTYNDEFLKCTVAKVVGQGFAISDWSRTSTHAENVLQDFIEGDFETTIQDIKNQVDHKVQTWYQSANPADLWEVPHDVRSEHVGDLWYCTIDIEDTNFKKDTTWQYVDNGEGVQPRYQWKQQNVPEEIFDKIDGKRAIYSEWNGWMTGSQHQFNQLQEEDLFIPQQDTTPYDVTFKANKVYRCTNAYGDLIEWPKDSGTWVRVPRFQEIAYTDDSAFNDYITQIMTGSGATGDSQTVANAIRVIKGALNEGTVHDGGLVLTSLISLRSNNLTWAGISGVYDGNLSSGGIAAWYGGLMKDYETLTDAQKADGWNTQRWSKSLFRFNGSGYLAGGNITWDAQGRVAIKDITTLVGGNNTDILNALTTFNNAFHFTTQQGTSTILNINPQYAFSHLEIYDANGNHSVATTDYVNDNFVTKAFFNRLFQAYSSSTIVDANKVSPNDTTTAINNLKILVGTWTEQYLSALGNNPNASGGGGISDLSAVLNELNSKDDLGTGVLVRNGLNNWSWMPYNAGSSGINENAMWVALGGTISNQKIDNSHLSLNSLTFKAGASDTSGVVYSPTGDADKTITFDAAANSGISVTKDNNGTFIIGYTMPSTMPSTSLVTNLNADLLDGHDSTYFVNSGTTWSKSTRHDGFIVDFRSPVADTENNPFSILGGNAATVIQNLPGNSTYGAQLAFGFGSARLLWRAKSNSASFSDWVGIIAGSADKLTTKKKIWGQDFDGTSDVTGSITGCTSIDSLLYFDTKNGLIGVSSQSPSYTLDVSGNIRATQPSWFPALELFGDGSSNIPYIDFHKGGSTTVDYTSRIAEYDTGILTVVAKTGATGLVVGGETDDDYIKIGGAKLRWTGTALECDKDFYSTGSVSALGSKSSGGQDTFNADLMWQELGTDSTAKLIPQLHLNLSGYALLTNLNGFVKSIKVGDQTKTPNANGLVDLGSIAADGYVTPITAGQVNTAKGDGKVWFKRASISNTYNDGTPNNGFVIEYGNSTSWVGQLYIGDNATQGLYWNGWSDGVRGSWKKIAFTSDLEGYAKTSELNNAYVTLTTTQTVSGQKTFNNLWIGLNRPWKFYSENETTGDVSSESLNFTTNAGGKNFYFVDIYGNKILQFAVGDTGNGTNGYLCFPYGFRTNGQVVSTFSGKPISVTSTTLCDNLNADMLDGKHLVTEGMRNPFDHVMYIDNNGVVEAGRYIDFHYDNNGVYDKSTRLEASGNYNNYVTLPSTSGTLALTSQLNDYLPLAGGMMRGEIISCGDRPWKFGGDKNGADSVGYMQATYDGKSFRFLSKNGAVGYDVLFTGENGTTSTANTAITHTLYGNVNVVSSASGKSLGRISVTHNISGLSWASDGGAISVRSTSENNAYTIGIAANTDGYSEIQSSQIGVGAKPLILQKNGGSIGVGITTPNAMLDVSGSLKAERFMASHNADANAGTGGWINVAVITIKRGYANQPLKFRVTQRGSWGVGGEITIKFESVSSTDANVRDFFYTGSITGAVLVKSGNTHSLYIMKAEPYENIGISLVDFGAYANDTFDIAWVNSSTSSQPNGTVASCRYYFANGVYMEYDAAKEGVHIVNGGLYTDKFVSTLGAGTSGSGGGDILLQPLSDINGKLSGTPTNGSVIMYTSSGWAYRTIGSTGITSIVLKTPTGFTVNNNSTATLVENGAFTIGFGGSVTKNYVLAAPSASNGTPSWRALVEGDIPNLSAGKITSGTLGVARIPDLDAGKINAGVFDKARIPDLSSTYLGKNATAASATMLSDTAAYQAWGQTFFENGKPKNVSGRLSMGSSGDIYWEESGDAKFCISASFAGSTDSNMLLLQSSTGGSSTLTTKIAVTAHNGNVGIGTTDIGAKLHVAGTLKVNGHVAINNPVLDAYWLYVDGNIRATQSSWLPSVHLFADSSNSTPYIDFHYGHTETDYTTRVIESTSGTLSIMAKTGATGLVVGTNTYGDSIKIGNATLKWTANGLECNTDFYSTGAVSALGSNTSGGSGISDISVAASLSGTLLTIDVSGQSGTVDLSPISGTSGDYIPLSGGNVVTGNLNPATGYNKLDLGNSTNKWRQLYLSEFASVSGLVSTKICIDCNAGGYNQYGGVDYIGEINNFDGKLCLQYSSNYAVTIGDSSALNANDKLYVNGQTRINGNLILDDYSYNNTNGYKLYADGNVNITGTLGTNGFTANMGNMNFLAIAGNVNTAYKLYIGGDGNSKSIYAEGSIYTHGSEVDYSDIRLKNIVEYVNDLTVDKVAKAPLFKYYWRDRVNDRLRIGTSAQYWQEVLPQAVEICSDGYLGMSYAIAALASSVSVARKVVDHELRIKQLEQENAILRKEIEELKAA